MVTRTNRIIVFAKAQLSAFLGGVVDYGVMIFCTEVFRIHYPISIVIGGTIGAALNFTVNRHWTFNTDSATKAPLGSQLAKFISVVAGGIFLKSTGTYLFTNWLQIDYKFSRIMVDIIVSFGFTYLLQTYWVFKKKPI